MITARRLMSEIEGLSYYFSRQFKTYRATHNRAEQRDAWTSSIINKVPCKLTFHSTFRMHLITANT